MRNCESRNDWRRHIAMAAVMGCLAAPSVAQESRQGELAQQQDQKPLGPNGPSGGERVFDWIEDYLTSPNHWYVTFGNLMPSSGLAPGAGYRGVLGDVARVDVRGAWSVRDYTLAEGVVEIPLADERFELAAHAGWRDGTQLPFYGLGDDSLKDQRTSYGLQTVDLGASASFRPSRWFRLGAGASAMLLENSDGRGPFPSIDTVFDPRYGPRPAGQPGLPARGGDGRDRLARVAGLHTPRRLLRRDRASV